ncbi:MAG: leucine-rich repeat domain-containing protein [Bacteroidales bacterium]|nr:leucine-rich repeat domain-containing protein [Bacteroidales bacterium]
MKKRLFLPAIFAVALFAGQNANAQDSVFSYKHQGTTLYYSVDGNNQATVRGPLPDTAYASELWPADAKPSGAVVIPDTVEHKGVRYPVVALARKLFYKCTEVTRVTIPQAVTAIPFGAFAYTSIDSMTLHEGITRIDSAAFQTCYNLASIRIPNTVTKIQGSSFYYDTSLISIIVPSGVDTVEGGAFAYCVNLSSAILSEGVKCIENFAFSSCHRLAHISLPSTLKTIGYNGFSQNESLVSLALPEGLTNVGGYAFYDCRSLRSVTLPSTLESIGDGVFLFCLSIDSLVFPDAMRHLACDVMDSCISLTWCHLPASLEYIDSLTFNYCFSLRSIDMPQHINSIRRGAFSECSSLEHIEVPEGVTYIEEAAFDHSGLRTIHLPSTLTSIGYYTFYAANQLDTLFLACATPPTLDTGVFSNYNATLVVPCGAIEAYRQHSVWGSFANIVESCTGIGEPESTEVPVRITSRDGRIIVEGAEGETVQVFDMAGRLAQTFRHSSVQALATGVYIVKVGNRPAKKVVVVR